MHRAEFTDNFGKTLESMFNIMKTKNKDYSTDSDPFSNFWLVESLWVTSTEKGILVRLLDKISRISNLIDNEANVKDESISDTLIDLANYAVILKIYINNKQKYNNESVRNKT